MDEIDAEIQTLEKEIEFERDRTLRAMDLFYKHRDAYKDAQHDLRTKQSQLNAALRKKLIAQQGESATMNLKSLIADESGATLVEYALVVGIIAIACITAIHFVGGKISNLFSTVGNKVSAA